MRQSEGNRTEKRLSATWPNQLRSNQLRSNQTRPNLDEVSRKTIEGLNRATMA
jgi:hypothetical protein